MWKRTVLTVYIISASILDGLTKVRVDNHELGGNEGLDLHALRVIDPSHLILQE